MDCELAMTSCRELQWSSEYLLGRKKGHNTHLDISYHVHIICIDFPANSLFFGGLTGCSPEIEARWLREIHPRTELGSIGHAEVSVIPTLKGVRMQ